MGCHTWAYKKVSALTDEEKDYFAKKAIEEATTWWGFKYTKEELIAEVEEWYKNKPLVFNVERCGTPEEYAMNMLDEFTQKRDLTVKEGFNYWLISHKDDYPTCFEHNGEQYVNIGFDSPFRVYGYPENGFISDKDSLLNFLKEEEEPGMIGYYDENDNYNFVSGYTDELVKRIDAYYDKHGENNIMFDFG